MKPIAGEIEINPAEAPTHSRLAKLANLMGELEERCLAEHKCLRRGPPELRRYKDRRSHERHRSG
ncbi:MAG: hypothetical protein ACREP9_14960, partial [Candidatus Dormibacteraceae bacterium]